MVIQCIFNNSCNLLGTKSIFLMRHFSGTSQDYFGSLAAIYDMFSAEQIGCAVEVLWAYNIEHGKPFENAQCKNLFCVGNV